MGMGKVIAVIMRRLFHDITNVKMHRDMVTFPKFNGSIERERVESGAKDKVKLLCSIALLNNACEVSVLVVEQKAKYVFDSPIQSVESPFVVDSNLIYRVCVFKR